MHGYPRREMAAHRPSSTTTAAMDKTCMTPIPLYSGLGVWGLGLRNRLLDTMHFGLDHVEVGLWFALQWNFSESIVEVIALYHETPAGALFSAASGGCPAGTRNPPNKNRTDQIIPHRPHHQADARA